MKNLLEKEDIGLKIMNTLSIFGTLPDKGFLAGGAVANTLLKMKYHKKEFIGNDIIHSRHGDLYPINDLDIFVETEGEKIKNYNTPIRSKELIMKEGYYAGEIDYDDGSSYRILKVERDELLNIITVSRVMDKENNKDYQYILKGFDFNCCQVGIDLSTAEIYYTPEFKKFLENKQLDVTSVYTPAHTAIRLFKKIKELDCYCDVEKCMEFLSQPLIYNVRWRLVPNQWGFYFGEKYKDLFMEHFSKLKKYFKLVRFFDDKKTMWQVRNEDLSPKPKDEKHIVNWLDPKNSIPTEQLLKWSKFNDIIWALKPIKYDKPNMEILDKAYAGYSSPIAFMNAYNYINGQMKKSLINKCTLIFENSSELKKILMINSDFADCDFTKNHIKELESFGETYKYFTTFILKYKFNLQESLTFFKAIKKILNKEGEWMSPIIEEYLQKGNKNIRPTYKSMCEYIKEYKKLMSKPLCEPLIDISKINLPKDVEVKEIISETEMQWAGNKLKNCINNIGQGYKDKIQSGLVKIFVIMTPNSTSAVEYHLDKLNSLEVNEFQLLSTCNRKPSQYHRLIADMLTNNINEHMLKSGYEQRIKTHQSLNQLYSGLFGTISDESTDQNPTVFPDMGMDLVEEPDDIFDFRDENTNITALTPPRRDIDIDNLVRNTMNPIQGIRYNINGDNTDIT